MTPNKLLSITPNNLFSNKYIALFIEKYNSKLRLDYKYNHLIDNRREQINEIFLHKIITRVIENDYKFSCPKLVFLKKRNGKYREVYSFDNSEKIYFSYINHLVQYLEINVHDNCYSFRTDKKISELIASVHHYIKRYPYKSVIRIDIKEFFKSITTHSLNSWLPDTIKKSYPIYSTIKNVLLNNQVILDGQKIEYTKKGIMQGFPLAPVLSNIFLSEFDQKMSEKFSFYRRYADDMIFIVDEFAVKESYEEIIHELENYLLNINEEKTVIYKGYHKAIPFLGFEISSSQIDISENTLNKFNSKVRRIARSIHRWKVKNEIDEQRALSVFFRKFEKKLYGCEHLQKKFSWTQWFFPVITSHKRIRNIDREMQYWARYIVTGRHRKLNYKKVPYKYLKNNGYVPLVSRFYEYRCRIMYSDSICN